MNQIGRGYLGTNIFRKEIDTLDVITYEYAFLKQSLEEGAAVIPTNEERLLDKVRQHMRVLEDFQDE